METLKSMELRTAVIAEMLRLNTSYAATLPVSAWMDILQVQMKEKVWPDSLSVDWMSDHNDLKLSGPVSLSMAMVASEFLLLSAKRGLVDMSSAVLYFSTSRRGDYILLEMADNGKGWQLEEATGSESGFSYALIHAYAASLGGAATFEVQNGMKMLVTFPV
jgi:two-component sensor histidine kinase